MKKLMLIINPAAGRGGYKLNLGEALHILDEGGYRTSLFFTHGPGEAINLAKEHGAEFDAVACIGGDGTLSDVIAGLMHLEKKPHLAYIPMGTTNDVASSLGLPKSNTVAAARCIVNGEPHPFDVGGFGTDQYFAYIAAFGAFTEVSYATPQSQKKILGHLAYVLQGAAQLPKIESVKARIEYDGGVLEDYFIYGSMTNSTSVAGIVRLPEDLVSLGDGKSELVLVKDPGSVEAFSELISSVVSRRFDSECLKIISTTHAKFTFERPVAWTRDGEAGGMHTEIELCNYPAPLQMIF